MRMWRLSDSDLYAERDEDPAQAGVDAVAEREVDDAVGPAEVDRRLRPLLGQRIEPLAGASRQHHYDDVVQHGSSALQDHARRRPVAPAMQQQANTSRTGPGPPRTD